MNILETMSCDDFTKAFAISFGRIVIENPNILLELYNRTGNDQLKELFNDLQNQEDLEYVTRNINNFANHYNWADIEKTYSTWGKYGWITNHFIVPLDFWKNPPIYQKHADKLVMSAINKKELLKLKNKLVESTNDKRLFNEAIKCFENKCYTACATLLIALIDGELIRNKKTADKNKKTGEKAGKQIVNIMLKEDMYGLPGYFHLGLINYETFISTLFASADGFKSEPRHINRNFLHHGMSKRRVLKRDCIKLLLAYNETLSYLNVS